MFAAKNRGSYTVGLFLLLVGMGLALSGCAVYDDGSPDYGYAYAPYGYGPYSYGPDYAYVPPQAAFGFGFFDDGRHGFHDHGHEFHHHEGHGMGHEGHMGHGGMSHAGGGHGGVH